MTDPNKIAETQSRTRPGSSARDRVPASRQEWDDFSLPAGSRVGEFELTGIVGKGGFGIVYLAWDHSLDRAVAIKEYMPASIASRKNRTQVNPLSERHRDTYQAGLSSFVNEAKLLAQFDRPSLVKVHRFWEANGTAYMAMPFYKGSTLGETVRSVSQAPSEAWLMDLLAPLTEALLELHSVQCYHRDISPDNILILADSESPLLLDFGAARRVIADQTQAVTVILKAGYAPIEQYATVPGLQQGPWTDVYALASVVYWSVTGKTPPAAIGRVIHDSHVPLAECASPQYSRGFVAAIDRALAVLPENRTQSIGELRSELGLSPVAERRSPPAFRWSDPEATVIKVSQAVSKRPTQAIVGPPDGHVEVAENAPEPHAPAPATKPLQRRFPLAARVAAGALLIAVVAGAWLLRSLGDAQAPSEAVSPLPPKPPPVLAETIPVPQSAAQALELILAKSDPTLRVVVDTGGARLQSGATPQAVSYTSSAPGHLYLMGLHAANDELRLLLPKRSSSPAPVQGSGKFDMPVDALNPGPWKFALVVAREPLDLGKYGWVADETVWRRRFAANIAPDLRALMPWGIPSCAPGLVNCDAAYGAAGFEVEVDAAKPVGVVKQAPAQSTRPPPKAEQATQSSSIDVARTPPKSARAAVNPECERILTRMSLGEAGQDLIDQMKTLKCK